MGAGLGSRHWRKEEECYGYDEDFNDAGGKLVG
jgi:hypothetical protein